MRGWSGWSSATRRRRATSCRGSPSRCPTSGPRIDRTAREARRPAGRASSSCVPDFNDLGLGRSEHRQVELLLAGDLAELVLGAGLDLADAFLGDAEFAAELLEGLLVGAADAEPADDDPTLAVVEPAE